MKQAHLAYEQKFFLDGTQISGVQSVNGSYNVQEKPINILGWGHIDRNYYIDSSKTFSPPNPDYILAETEGFILNEQGFKMATELSYDAPYNLAVVNSPLEGNFSINSTLVSEDFFIKYTGDNPFAGSIHYNDKYFGFESGYISSHSISCSVGQLPTTSTDIRVFGDIGGSPDYIKTADGYNIDQENEFSIVDEKSRIDGNHNASGNNPFPEIKIPNQGSISVECFGAETDRVTSFSHSIDIPLDPIYIVGSSSPVQVDVSWPMSSTTSISLDVDEYEYHSMREYLKSPNLDDVKIKINDCFGGRIQHYVIKGARLVSESMSASVDGRMTVNLQYKSYYNRESSSA